MKDQAAIADKEHERAESAIKDRENARVAEQAVQARLESAARELEALKETASEARQAEKKALEEAALLRGKLEALTKPEPKTTHKAKKVTT
ncbi:MAG: hypothetical protein PHE55_00450 [Methylococcaceae bacterium]|nr:hypothetical protein [Methylococcaceae bacterium]